MADRHRIEARLRDKLNRFLKRPGPLRVAAETLKTWDSRGWGPILFGGVIRDFVVLGRRRYPRDVDIVLQRGDLSAVANGLESTEYHFNRFGGLHLNIERWVFDVWLLEKTWAFTVDSSLHPTADELPKTTFLDAEAVAVTFEQGRVSEIYSNGFFECVASRRIDINYEPNPFPSLNAVRAILTAHKLAFAISPRLAKYYLETLATYGPHSMIDAQERHYQKVILDTTALCDIERHLQTVTSKVQPADRVYLPAYMHPKQLQLWTEQVDK
jgi:hypothetical protein